MVRKKGRGKKEVCPERPLGHANVLRKIAAPEAKIYNPTYLENKCMHSDSKTPPNRYSSDSNTYLDRETFNAQPEMLRSTLFLPRWRWGGADHRWRITSLHHNKMVQLHLKMIVAPPLWSGRAPSSSSAGSRYCQTGLREFIHLSLVTILVFARADWVLCSIKRTSEKTTNPNVYMLNT